MGSPIITVDKLCAEAVRIVIAEGDPDCSNVHPLGDVDNEGEDEDRTDVEEGAVPAALHLAVLVRPAHGEEALHRDAEHDVDARHEAAHRARHACPHTINTFNNTIPRTFVFILLAFLFNFLDNLILWSRVQIAGMVWCGVVGTSKAVPDSLDGVEEVRHGGQQRPEHRGHRLPHYVQHRAQDHQATAQTS